MGKPTKDDLLFSELCKKHRERFGVNYGANFFDRRPLSEHIAILEKALDSGIPAIVPQMTNDDRYQI